MAVMKNQLFTYDNCKNPKHDVLKRADALKYATTRNDKSIKREKKNPNTLK